MADPPLSEWLARLQAAQPAEHDLRLTNLEAQQTVSAAVLAALVQKIDTLEVRMGATDDKIAEISANLDNVTADVTWLKDEVQRLQSELAAQDPALAAKLQPLADRIQALADSVPDVTPTPEPEPTP